jgi:hypothetical protein
VRGLLKFRLERQQNTIDVFEDIVVPNPNDTIAESFNGLVTRSISGAFGLLAAVDLDD